MVALKIVDFAITNKLENIMKRSIVFLIVVVLSFHSFAQQTTPAQPLTKEDYLKKSKSQKTTAFILLGIGAGCIAIAAPGNVSFDVLPILVIGGGAAAVSSIFLFSAAKRNKKRAMKMTASMDVKKIPNVSSSGIFNSSYPAISFKINI